MEPQPPSFGVPVVERLPLRVGYAFEPSVSKMLYKPLGSRLDLGPATRTAFERMFSALFIEARPVDDVRSLQETPGQLDGIIRVGIVDVSSGADWVQVACEVIFLNPDGTREGRWRVEGVDKTGLGLRRTEPIRQAVAKLSRDLDRQPAIRTWLKRHSSSDANPSANG